MGRLIVHPRVMARHPEISEDDAISAWDNALASTPRVGKNPDEYIALGFDGKGRLLEVVAVRLDDANWLIFHAMAPPSSKTFAELGIDRRRQ